MRNLRRVELAVPVDIRVAEQALHLHGPGMNMPRSHTERCGRNILCGSRCNDGRAHDGTCRTTAQCCTQGWQEACHEGAACHDDT
eukprot:333965-Chlamydomonas_euryale.AAC.2